MNILFDIDGNLKSNVLDNMEFEEIVKKMGVTLDKYGVVENVNWSLMNSMKDNKYSVDSDFSVYYYSIIVSKKSGQSLSFLIDNWMWCV